MLGVSDQTIARRYARLRATSALRVVGLATPELADGPQWLVRVRATPDAARRVADALARRPDTSWVHLCSGGTEIVCAVDATAVDPLLLEVLPRTRQVLDVQAQQALHRFYGGAGEPFTKYGPLDDSQVARLAEHVPLASATSSSAPDAVHRRMLDMLREDGRASVDDLASATQVSTSTVRRRLNDLRASGLLHLDVDVDQRLLTHRMCTMLWLRVRPDGLASVGRALAKHTEVAYAAATTGAANVFAYVVTHDAAALHRYLSIGIAGLSAVNMMETAPVLRTVKAAVTQYAEHSSRPPAP